jgi:hypothetical protein
VVDLNRILPVSFFSQVVSLLSLASFQNVVFEHFSNFWEYFQTSVFVSFAHSSVLIQQQN